MKLLEVVVFGVIQVVTINYKSTLSGLTSNHYTHKILYSDKMSMIACLD